MSDWKKLAKAILEEARKESGKCVPERTLALFDWRGHIYFGQTQKVYPNVYPDVVFISKMTQPLCEEFWRAIKEESPEILVLTVHNEIDLEGNYHMLRQIGSELSKMTPDQTEYAIEHQPVIQDQTKRPIDGKLVDYGKEGT